MPKGRKGEKRPADVVGAAVKVDLIDAVAPKPDKRGPYKKRNGVINLTNSSPRKMKPRSDLRRGDKEC